ncbi:MAG: amylo-alpha-1,6-glucosidase [Herpetosiphon sp.]
MERTARATSTVVERPLIDFGREICGDLPAGLRREWLVTNGLGGYASGTLAGINTRRYHGLLLAALQPPVGRKVLVAGTVEWATYDGQRYGLSTHEYAGGTIEPRGYRYLQSFRLEGMLPVWTFAMGDALLERRVWMAHGANTTYVRYQLVRGSGALELEITPLTTYRDFHALRRANEWQPTVELEPQGVRVHTLDGGPEAIGSFRLLAEGGTFRAGGDWYYNFAHREEATRGLDDRSDLYAPGGFYASLEVRAGATASVTLVLTTDGEPVPDGAMALAAARRRQVEVLQRAGADGAHPVVQQLTLAADQFIVQRGGESTASEPGKTVIAGYHWFNDWGRDTMIALPGLTLTTGRTADAADILRTFARYVRDGLLPNNFPDSEGATPGYNTADATLWYVLAIRAYHDATGDEALVDELLPVLREIVEQHRRGTHYHIGVDAADGLLHAGEPGVQLTWMDAKVGDWVVTPRIGKPVEINALWYNVLRTLERWLLDRHEAAATTYGTEAARVRESFRRRYMHPEHGSLADVVDGPDGDDWRLRPNQIFAVSLPYPLLEVDEGRAVVDVVGRSLLASCGLRSLGPDDRAYHGAYGGDAVQRDGAYHQGVVWTWLIGAYAEAYARVYHDPAAGLGLLEPLVHHLQDGGLGSVSEILEGDAPHLPRGCIAQAWGVGEMLRVWHRLEQQAATCVPGER